MLGCKRKMTEGIKIGIGDQNTLRKSQYQVGDSLFFGLLGLPTQLNCPLLGNRAAPILILLGGLRGYGRNLTHHRNPLSSKANTPPTWKYQARSGVARCMTRNPTCGAKKRPNPLRTCAHPMRVSNSAGPCHTLWNATMIAPKFKRRKPSRKTPAVPRAARA